MYGLKKPVISRLWKNTTFVCLECEEENDTHAEMIPYEQNGRVYYRCQKCGFMMPYYEIEKAIDKLISFLIDDDEDEAVNLKNTKWSAIEKSAGIRYEYRVLRHKGEKLTVGIKKISLG